MAQKTLRGRCGNFRYVIKDSLEYPGRHSILIIVDGDEEVSFDDPWFAQDFAEQSIGVLNEWEKEAMREAHEREKAKQQSETKKKKRKKKRKK